MHIGKLKKKTLKVANFEKYFSTYFPLKFAKFWFGLSEPQNPELNKAKTLREKMKKCKNLLLVFAKGQTHYHRISFQKCHRFCKTNIFGKKQQIAKKTHFPHDKNSRGT